MVTNRCVQNFAARCCGTWSSQSARI